MDSSSLKTALRLENAENQCRFQEVKLINGHSVGFHKLILIIIRSLLDSKTVNIIKESLLLC